VNHRDEAQQHPGFLDGSSRKMWVSGGFLDGFITLYDVY
jgi:hypothetical protein